MRKRRIMTGNTVDPNRCLWDKTFCLGQFPGSRSPCLLQVKPTRRPEATGGGKARAGLEGQAGIRGPASTLKTGTASWIWQRASRHHRTHWSCLGLFSDKQGCLHWVGVEASRALGIPARRCRVGP
ncbi:hypothetical protein HJG60_008198 [Phyllostomus discolor]|uniref:Uncharacterized protein n=1 Tax=Phyllostomus discolor TaxID=89673 RepID=A0A833ZCB0_9CHIR|nr:hypothetical protein HJG60_008198 [Phyllostomus discolor]